jgi:hypothetical protein
MTNVTTISILPVREPSVQLQQGIPSVFLVEDLVPAPMILLAHCGPDEDSVSTASASPAPRTLPARCSPDVSSSVFVRPRTSAHVPASSATLVDVVGSGSTPTEHRCQAQRLLHLFMQTTRTPSRIRH